MVDSKQQRVEAVNKLIKVIADHGRGFFKTGDNYAKMEVDNRGRIWFIDDYTGKRIYTHYNGRWRGFSHGGTLKDLVKGFRDYISKGVTHSYVPKFGPWPSHFCDGDLWGYGNDMVKVRQAAKRLGFGFWCGKEK